MASETTKRLIAQAIADYWDKHGYGPSYQDIRDMVPGPKDGKMLSKSMLKYYLDILEAEGVIEPQENNVARSTRLRKG